MFFLLQITEALLLLLVVVVVVVIVVEEQEIVVEEQEKVKRWWHCPKWARIIVALKIFQDKKDILIVIKRYSYSDLSRKIDSKFCSRPYRENIARSGNTQHSWVSVHCNWNCWQVLWKEWFSCEWHVCFAAFKKNLV